MMRLLKIFSRKSICKNVKSLIDKEYPKLKRIYDSISKNSIEVSVGICRLDDGSFRLTKKKIFWDSGTFIPRCENGELAGVVHTHPSILHFSPEDYETAIENDLDFMCVIARDGKKLKMKCVRIPERGSEKWEDLVEKVEEFKGMSMETDDLEALINKSKEIENNLESCTITL